MTHREIEEKEIIQRYVLHHLSSDERRAFQEHYFSCDECSDRAQMEARFIASVRQASRDGVLVGRSTETFKTSGPSLLISWLKPAFALTAAAAVALAIALGWLVFSHIPGMQREIAREREAREQIERENQQQVDTAKDELETERRQNENERLERAKEQSQVEELARNTPSDPNVPLVMLDAARDSQDRVNELSLPASAGNLMIWIDVESGTRFSSFRLEILDSNKRLVETVVGAKPNSYGALVVSVPAASLQSGKYVVKLYGLRGGRRELAGEYDLQVLK